MDLCLCGKNQQSDISNLTNTPRESNNRKRLVILFPTTLFKTLSVYYLSLSQSLFFSLTRYLITSPSLCISLSLCKLSLPVSICLTLFLSLTPYLIIPLSHYPSLSLSNSLSYYLSLSLHLSLSLSLSLCILSLPISICLTLFPSLTRYLLSLPISLPHPISYYPSVSLPLPISLSLDILLSIPLFLSAQTHLTLSSFPLKLLESPVLDKPFSYFNFRFD